MQSAMMMLSIESKEMYHKNKLIRFLKVSVESIVQLPYQTIGSSEARKNLRQVLREEGLTFQVRLS